MKYQKKILTLIVLLLTFSCKNEQAITNPTQLNNPSKRLSRIVDPNDPNLNPNLDWNNPATNYITAYCLNGSGNIIQRQITVPWKTQGNKLNVPDPDIKTANGWVMVMRDVGTSSRGVDFPFYMLYNKYRGILRILVYNAQRVAANYFKGELQFNSTSYTNSCLSFTANKDKALKDSYDPNVAQSALAYANTFDAWINFDFVLINYDPSISNNDWLKFNMYQVNESELTLNSTEFTLKSDYLTKLQPGADGKLFDPNDPGYKMVGTINDTKKIIKDAGLNSLFTAVNSATSIFATVGVIGKFMGLIDAFSGGQNSVLPTQLIDLKGTLKLNGNLTNTIPTHSIVFSLKNQQPLSAAFYQPITNITFGIFNLNKSPKPTYTGTYVSEQIGEGIPGCDYYYTYEANFKNQLELLINPNSGLTLIKKEIGIVDKSAPNNVSYQLIDNDIPFFIYGNGAPQYPDEFVLKLTFKAATTSGLDDEIVFMKTYKYIGNGVEDFIDRCSIHF